jgi:hypothetical protein
MATAPAFAATPRCAIVQATAANTNRDGTGTIATLFTAGASGSRVERVRIQAAGTTTAGVVRLCIHDGTNARLLREVLVTAITPSTTVEAFSADVDFSGPDQVLVLPTGYSLRVSTHNAETFNCFAFGGDF